MLAAYVGAAPDDLTFVQNTTTGVNMAARSLDLQPGDEVLATGLEYGACDLAWEAICAETGARYVRVEMPLPVGDVVEQLFAARTERTRVVYASHITSATGVLLPVEEIVRRAREAGLVTVVDGAHAPGQVPLDLEALGADFYAGELPQVALRAEGRRLPPRAAGASGSRRGADRQLGARGARDVHLPDGGAGNARRGRLPERPRQRSRSRPSTTGTRSARGASLRAAKRARELCELLGTEPIAPEEMVLQMASVRLPVGDGESLERTLWDDHRIEIP